MRWVAVAAALGLSITFIVPAGPVSAHTHFVLQGYAFDGSALYGAAVVRTYDPYPECPVFEPGPGGEFGCLKWIVQVRQLNFGDFVAQGFFLGDDTWVAPEVDAGFVGEYHAVSIDPTVDFALDGYQTSEFVTATGHFGGYTLVVSFLPTFV